MNFLICTRFWVAREMRQPKVLRVNAGRVAVAPQTDATFRVISEQRAKFEKCPKAAMTRGMRINCAALPVYPPGKDRSTGFCSYSTEFRS